MMLDAVPDPQLFVVSSLHYGLVWFQTHRFCSVSIELNPGVFAPGLTCV